MSEDASSILRHGPLTRFWLARVATAVAFQMQAVAVGWQLYDLTNNPVDLGLVGLIQFIPVLPLILVTGQIVGTANRLGDFRAGLMAAWLGAVPAVLIGGLGILAVVVVWAKVFPALYRVERFPST